MKRLSLPSALVSLALVPACTAPADSLPSRCEAIEVDATRELVVTDADTVADPAFSFARVMSAILGPDAGVGARRFMDSWATMPGGTSVALEVTGP